MAFKIGSAAVFPGIYTAPTAAATGHGVYSDGTTAFWSYPGSTDAAVGTGFQYRSIITHGFLAGGYKGSNPWRSVNKTWHANDITFYCGEQLDRPVTYTDGCFSDYNGYVFGGTQSFQGSSAHTGSINLHNGLGRNRGPDLFGSAGTAFGYVGNNPAGEGILYGVGTPAAADSDTARVSTGGLGGWAMSVIKDAMSCTSAQIAQFGVITGGGSITTNRLHFASEVMYTGPDPAAGMSGNHGTGCGAENYGYHFAGATAAKYNYAAHTWAAGWGGTVAHTAGICKILPTKLGYFYGGSGANVTLGQYKYNYTTDTNGAMANKVRSMGEENFQMGQDHGYCLGNYDNQQNNHTVKYNYLNDVQTTMGSNTRPKGHTGQSSAANFSAAASITSAYTG
jgi:hypothetical protein